MEHRLYILQQILRYWLTYDITKVGGLDMHANIANNTAGDDVTVPLSFNRLQLPSIDKQHGNLSLFSRVWIEHYSNYFGSSIMNGTLSCSNCKINAEIANERRILNKGNVSRAFLA
ncbi:hypothetical protein AVEN_272151-1 [Araneus ventricosus]|uniref:Uncharacterized protein n=1 Tax=Araneus ventricosus TaxID=182803 RepID=A0A4Y2UPA7_ARAVE|nr:hypothetical protein AVEN_272151-1 [Araneus ventricosus]